MILFRIREYGRSEWTEVCLEGEVEDIVAEQLSRLLLADDSPTGEGYHVQRRQDGEWEDI